MARNSIRKQTEKKAAFVGSTVVGVKEIKKTVYSKRQGKNVEVTEYRGSFEGSNGNGFSIKISKSSKDALSGKGVGYWAEIAEFTNTNDRR